MASTREAALGREVRGREVRESRLSLCVCVMCVESMFFVFLTCQRFDMSNLTCQIVDMSKTQKT